MSVNTLLLLLLLSSLLFYTYSTPIHKKKKKLKKKWFKFRFSQVVVICLVHKCHKPLAELTLPAQIEFWGRFCLHQCYLILVLRTLSPADFRCFPAPWVNDRSADLDEELMVINSFERECWSRGASKTCKAMRYKFKLNCCVKVPAFFPQTPTPAHDTLMRCHGRDSSLIV